MSCFSVSLQHPPAPQTSPFCLRSFGVVRLQSSHTVLCPISPFFNDSLSLAFIPDEILTSSCYSWFTSLAPPPIERFLRAVTRTRAATCLHLAAFCVCCLPFSCELSVTKAFWLKLAMTEKKQDELSTLSSLSSHCDRNPKS